MIRIASVLEISGIELPEEEAANINVVVAINGAALRESPRVDDTPFANDGPWDRPGNLYALVEQGAKGKVVGRRSDSGETWLFVVLNAAAPLTVDYVPDSYREGETSRSGWMDAKDLTVTSGQQKMSAPGRYRMLLEMSTSAAH